MWAIGPFGHPQKNKAFIRCKQGASQRAQIALPLSDWAIDPKTSPKNEKNPNILRWPDDLNAIERRHSRKGRRLTFIQKKKRNKKRQRSKHKEITRIKKTKIAVNRKIAVKWLKIAHLIIVTKSNGRNGSRGSLEVRLR